MKAASIGKISQKGSSTLEILIAFAVLTLAITSVIVVAFGNQSNSTDTQTTSEALYKAQAMLEDARALSRQNFDLVESIAPIADSIYQKKLLVEDFDDSTKTVTSTVTWSSEGRILSVSLNTIFTGPATSNTCNSILSGDWTLPTHYDFASPNLMPTNNGLGIGISDLKAYHQKLYVAAKTTGNSSDTFYIFSLPANPMSPPIYQGSIDNFPTVSVGLSALTVFGNYAYVANSYTGSASGCTEAANCAQLQVINISNPTNPFVARNLKIGAIATGNKLSAGTSIAYSKGYIYLGLAKVSGGGYEFNVIDVGGGGTGASPTNPIWRGGYAVGNGINSIFVKSGYAYIATPNSENMTILDVSDPNNPHRVGGYTPTTGSNNGESVYVVGSKAYLGRTFGTNEFYILNASNPASVASLGSKDVGTGNATSINGLVVRDYLAFMLTNFQFQIWDVSNAANVSTKSSILLTDFGATGGTALNCSGNYLYAALTSSQGANKDIISILTPNP